MSSETFRRMEIEHQIFKALGGICRCKGSKDGGPNVVTCTGHVLVNVLDTAFREFDTVKASAVADALRAEREQTDKLYDAALAFCHSIETKLKRARGTRKEIALEQALRAEALRREEK